MNASACVEIVNERGLHARASAKFVKLAGEFDAEIEVRKDENTVDAQSIMGLMMLAAGPGSTPRLAPAQWESLMARLIGGRQFEAAEHLVLRLLALPETRAAARQQAGQLAEALAASDQPERAIPLQRLLSSQTNAT